MKQSVLQVNKEDNVLVALARLSKGTLVSFNNKEYRLQDDIPAKHKFFKLSTKVGFAFHK